MCNKLEQIGHNDDNNRRTLWAVREHKQAELLKKEETGPICCVTLIQTWLTLNNEEDQYSILIYLIWHKLYFKTYV